ncbi:hypothetical protein JX265_000163 [Neoarthrinium moseri]|uniref:Dicer-like protein 1 n=1 Tax=Neoarthrinium moseri TaxID=1658444 RepID=A0A9P9WYD4_9PEZI|nr:hypothetical protein JX265_000163 [Neoarthrinium moseri]
MPVAPDPRSPQGQTRSEEVHKGSSRGISGDRHHGSPYGTNSHQDVPQHGYQHAASTGLPTLLTDLSQDSGLGSVDPQVGASLHDDHGEAGSATKPSEDSDLSEGDEPVVEEPKARKVTARRLADQDQFEHWMRQEQKRANKKLAESALGDNPSIRWDEADVDKILSSRDPAQKRIISSPREYQVELFERAKKKNLIVVLPTGTGKTLIAALLIRHTLEQELIDRNSKERKLEPRVTFFLVDKVSLVYQQWKVLKANLSHPVAKFHGQLVDSMSTQGFWKQQLEENMAIVCTAAILQQCLSRGYFNMDQINLLIFDEAHHAKKNHPYSRIIKDFYADLQKGSSRRPRILGMTASPVDAKTDLATTAAQLEGLLHCEIATVDQPDLLRSGSLERQGGGLETLVEYGLSYAPFTTPLGQRLHKLIGKNSVFRKLFVFSKASTRELGPWCADRVWQLGLPREEIVKAKARTERNLLSTGSDLAIEAIDARVADIEDAYREIQKHPFPAVDPTRGHLSHKVISLLGILKQHFRPAFDKCMIFVEQRLTAIVLDDLFKQLPLALYGLQAGTLLGSGTGVTGEHESMSYAQQQRAIQRFHTGDLNILIATTIAEEGLDIPDCNIIIRFDLYRTMIQYIQSKGRARMKNSKYFHMVEVGNEEHAKRVFDCQEKEELLHAFCSTMPEDRLLKGNDFDMDFFLRKDKSKRVFKIEKTGAKLTYESSLVVLASYVSSLAGRADMSLQADYVVKSVSKEYQCEVILPDNSTIKSALGRRATSKQVAKCSAAFEMCVKLRKAGELDDYLQSIHQKRLPAMRNAHLALSSKKRAEYDMRVKPEIWDRRGLPGAMYMTVLKLESPEALGRPSRPLAIVTREPLPQVARFPIFFGNQQTSVVNCLPLESAFTISLEQVQALTEFSLRILQDVFSKEYRREPEKMPYYLAPLNKDHLYTFGDCDQACDLISWDCVTMIHEAGDLDWEGQPLGFFNNRYLTDPHDGSRKFYTLCPRADLKPTDPQVPGVKGLGNNRARRDAPNDIWNYSISKWSKSRSRMEVRNDLPVVEAEYIPLRRNLLDEFEGADQEGNKCFVTFATLKVSALPVEVVAMAYNLPAIIHRLESSLIVLEACDGWGLQIRPDLALEAMTKDSDNTGDHAAEQVNFQRGMGNNYERLEFLGDSFLKMSTTIALYSQIPEGNEFDYHVDRMLLICNKNLFNNALDLKVEAFIRSKSFNRRKWYPEGLEQLSGKMNTSIKGKKGAGRNIHVLGDKSIADVCEALIGAAYLTGKESNSLDMAVQAVTKFSNNKLENKNHTMVAYGEFYSAFKVPEWQAAEPTAVHLHLAKLIEEQLGYNFAHPRLLRCAFIHPSYSYMYEHIPHYQRLEFLGDALLDMVCVDYLFHRYPGADPQWLTEHKMAMVSNQFLGCLCVALGFQRHMISMTGGLQQQIAQYVDAITTAREDAEDEAEAAYLEPSEYSRDFWTSVIEPPKCLPDIVEAYIGAIFVDSKYDLGEVQKFFDNHIRPYFEDMHLYDSFANKHPVTFLSNCLHLNFGCANWRVMVNEMPAAGGSLSEKQVVAAVLIHGQVRAHATASSGRYAKIAAAKKCMAMLDNMQVHEFKEQFGCNCKPEEVAESNPTMHATAV